jgi:hypothetical protein
VSLKDIITKDVLDANRKKNESLRSVAVYLNTLPGDSNAGRSKIEIMKAFAVPLSTDPSIELTLVRPTAAEIDRRGMKAGKKFTVYDTEFSFSFGYHFSKNPGTLRACLRKDLTKKHKKDGKIWYTDANPLKCYEQYNKKACTRVRIAYGDIYPNKAEYFNKNSPSDRWEQIAKEQNLEVKPYKDLISKEQADCDKGFIYICCNRGSSGYSAFGKNAADWAIETALEIRKYTSRPIVIRQHGASRYEMYQRDKRILDDFAARNRKEGDLITIESPTGTYPNLIERTKKAHAVVVFTSTAGMPAIIEGTPVFVEHESSFLYAMSAGKYKDIENPNRNLNRNQYLYDYAYAHWSIEELKEGLYWNRVRNQILSYS